MVPQKVSIDGSKATKVIAIFCFLEKVPIILWMQKIEVRLFELHPDPIQGGVVLVEIHTVVLHSS